MAATSDDLEKFHDRVKDADSLLAKLKNAEVKRSDTIEKLGQLSKTGSSFPRN
jgi:hypothetical protein